MTPQTGSLWNLGGALFELLETREEIAAQLNANRSIVIPVNATDDEEDDIVARGNELQLELAAIETGIQQFVAQQLRDVDGLRAPLKALEQGVAINRADAAAATNRAMVLQNRFDRLKDLIKQCMIALDQAGEWKPKESRKFESARGSFTLRGNGGTQPVEIHDESLIPDEYCTVQVRFPASLWMLGASWEQLVSDPRIKVGPREVRKSAVAEALAKPCPQCNGVCEPTPGGWCLACGNTGRQGIPGARLAPRGESVIVK